MDTDQEGSAAEPVMCCVQSYEKYLNSPCAELRGVMELLLGCHNEFVGGAYLEIILFVCMQGNEGLSGTHPGAGVRDNNYLRIEQRLRLSSSERESQLSATHTASHTKHIDPLCSLCVCVCY